MVARALRIVFGCVYVARRAAKTGGIEGRVKARRRKSINLAVVRRCSVETGGDIYLAVMLIAEKLPLARLWPQVGSSKQLPGHPSLARMPASLIFG